MHPARSAGHTTRLLLERFQSGDQNAGNDLVERLQPLLTRFARGRVPVSLRASQDTADLVQQSWVQSLDRIREFRADHPGALFGYLRAALLNVLRERLRRERVSGAALSSDPDAFSPVAGLAAEDWTAYEQMMDRLQPEIRILVQMRIEFGMSFPEIGAELDLPPDAARMRFHRAIAALAGG